MVWMSDYSMPSQAAEPRLAVGATRRRGEPPTGMNMDSLAEITKTYPPDTASRDLRNLLLFTGFLGLVLLVPGPSFDEPPGPFDHLLPEGSDKVVHFALFGLESYFLHRFLRHGSVFKGLAGGWIVGATCGLALAMAGLTEICQTLVPGRSADFWDVVADSLGILGWWLMARVLKGQL